MISFAAESDAMSTAPDQRHVRMHPWQADWSNQLKDVEMSARSRKAQRAPELGLAARGKTRARSEDWEGAEP